MTKKFLQIAFRLSAAIAVVIATLMISDWAVKSTSSHRLLISAIFLSFGTTVMLLSKPVVTSACKCCEVQKS